MPTQAIWISYDLGVNGDYESLYSWLDDQDAKECGDSVAFIGKYSYKNDLTKELKEELSSSLKIRSRDRVYLLYKKDDSSNYSGKFIFGNRKASPWEGQGSKRSQDETDE